MTTTSRTITAEHITRIKRTNGLAGQYQVAVTVRVPEQPAWVVRFVANTFGGPVVMVLADSNGRDHQFTIDSAVLDRLGRRVDRAWVMAFYGIEES